MQRVNPSAGRAQLVTTQTLKEQHLVNTALQGHPTA